MPAKNVITEEQQRILVQVEGVNLDHSPWKTYEGGAVQGATSTSHPGGMDGSMAFGGPKSRANATVTRWYSTDVLHPLVVPLEKATSRKKITISRTPLDGDKNPVGETIVEVGILKEAMHPPMNADSGTVCLLTLVAELDEEATTVANA